MTTNPNPALYDDEDERPEEKPIEVRVYVETAEQAAWEGDHAPPPTPIKLAKEAMSKMLRADGYSLRDSSVTEVLDAAKRSTRIKVVVDNSEQGWHKADERETPTGMIVHFTAVGVLSEGDDSNVPIVTVEAGEDGVLRALVPVTFTDRGGDLRVRHNLNTDEVTVRLARRDGSRIGYIVAADLDGNVQHVTGADKGANQVVVLLDADLTKRASKPERALPTGPTPSSPSEPVIH